MAKLEDVFGGQITGLNALMQETTTSMRDTRDRFAELVANLSGAGQSAGRAMSEQLTHAMEAAELRQREMNDQMRQFIEQIRDLVSKSQSETSEKLNSTLNDLGTQVGQIINGLSEQQAKAGEQANQRQEQLSGQAEAMVSNLGANVGALISQSSEVVQAMRDSVNGIRTITTESIQKMNAGAETLYIASSDFSKAGHSVTGVFERANQLSEQLSAAAAGLDAATKTVQLTVAAYDKTRSDVAVMMESLKAIIESAKREAGLSKELVTDLESAASKFNVVQKDADAYLEKVSSILEETFAKFTDSMRQSLDKSRANFDTSLGDAVGMLRATIEDLDDGLSKISRRN
jgi:ABC-type transporter Mla subunit MlaD